MLKNSFSKIALILLNITMEIFVLKLFKNSFTRLWSKSAFKEFSTSTASKQYYFKKKTVLVNTYKTEANNFFISFTNIFLGEFVIFTFLTYPRLDFLKIFFTKLILKILKFSYNAKHLPVNISVVRIKVQERS